MSNKRNALFYRMAASESPLVILADFQQGAESVRLNVTNAVKWLARSLDENVLAVSAGHQVGLWDLEPHAWWKWFEADVGEIAGAGFVPGSSKLGVSDLAGHLAVWDIPEGKRLGALTNASGRFGLLSCSPDGRWVVNPGGAAATQIWNLDWLKEQPSQDPPPYLGPFTNYPRPGSPPDRNSQ